MADRRDALEQPALASHSLSVRSPSAGRAYSLLVVAVLGVLVVLGSARSAAELRFFGTRSPYTAPGMAPVPQDDTETPALDASLRAVAAMLPRDATCVIAVDAWRRDYFRASYILMPRRIWPAADLPSDVSLTPAALHQVMALRHASCLLAAPGTDVPPGLRQAYSGAIVLYRPAGHVP